ncbi:TPA: hypothetical protein N0F65_006063 [Lagenidium giganteum]|uniref:MaoC-like domain-containing protein n=1 Tax=Lagenidium giganteum TaxID=4803 RepID=A0AAV2YQT0_9STRA|nr:TPA: hypothetical protein N0F65_006063 [Lagenidium giganteum]
MSSDEEKVNAARILSAEPMQYTATYNQRDLLVYAMGIGETNLQFTFEQHENFAAFPLYPVVLPFKSDKQDVVPFPPPTASSLPDGMPFVNPAMILHGEQSLELLQPLPVEGAKLACTSRVISFYDKGKGALMETETIMRDEQGNTVARLIAGSFLRGLTGFEGKGRKLPPLVKMPAREPDVRDVFKTTTSQALIYRLSGDYNALHADPEIAQSVGFRNPILHGLCTMGIATRALYKTFCGGDPRRFKTIRVRFASPCYPGETLETRMWRDGNRVLFQVIVQERQKVIIDGGEFVFDGEATSKL